MRKLLNILSRNYFISFIISVLITVIILSLTKKYELNRVSKENSKNIIHSFHDLDGDKNSEEIKYFFSYKNRASIIVLSKGKVLDQWNFKGNLIRYYIPFFADTDNDGTKELIIFTQIKDSIYLHILDALNNKVLVENKAVIKVYKGKGDQYDYGITPFSATDVNADGYKELYFLIQSGYATQPRRLFAYFPAKKRILISPESYAFIQNPHIYDFENDGKPEIVVQSYAYGNCKTKVPYTDMDLWLMAFTPDLKFKFKPIRFDKYPARLYSLPFNTGKNKYILCIRDYSGTDTIVQNFTALYDISGKEILKKKLRLKKGVHIVKAFAKDSTYKSIYAILTDGSIIKLDSLLNFKEITKQKGIKDFLQQTDVDNDGEKELFFITNPNNSILILKNNFKDAVRMKFDEYDVPLYGLSVLKKENERNKIIYQTIGFTYTFDYDLSKTHKYWYLLFSSIFISILILWYSLKYLKKYSELKKDTRQRQIAELQMKSIQNQIDPHFTLNIMASIGRLINEEDRKRANFVFKKYSQMLTQVIKSGKNIKTTLGDELDFVKTYLDLEKFRYANKFDYQINIAKNVDLKIQIPRMLIHIFAENAVKHGLRHLDNNGNLIIEIKQKNGNIIIRIKDNGIGRKKAQKYNKYSTGKGINIIENIIEDYRKLYRIKIDFVIKDLDDGKKENGTLVEIKIPNKIKIRQ